jgi:hypothetical protein
MNALEPREMRKPLLPLAADAFRVGELKLDVLEVVGECLARQTLHILEYKGLRSPLAYGADRFWEHVAAIVLAAVPPTNREWLTGWSARYEINWPLNGLEIDRPHITLDEGPAHYWLELTCLIIAYRVTTIAIPFNHRSRRETSTADPKS